MKFEGKLEGREYPPRAARVTVRFDASVRFDLGKVEAEVLNVSSEGFRLRSPVEFEPDTEVTLEVQRLHPVKAIIRWVTGNECGGVFVEPVAL
jgi:PilZ domain-containing protein